MRTKFSNNKKTYGFLALRWLILPLLFYAFAGFLEGPPTRVVVRSFTFVIGCFSLSILAAQFLQQVRRIPIALSIIQALFIPGGYIYFAQLYYDGGKNQDYSIAIGIFFLLLMFNAAVYLNGLFSLCQKVPSATNNIEPTTIEDDEASFAHKDYAGKLNSFEITLYELDPEGQRSKVILHKQGHSEPPKQLVVDGFSQDRYIDLSGYWDEILEDRRKQYCTDLTTHETIVKFGETMQLMNRYQLVFNLTY